MKLYPRARMCRRAVCVEGERKRLVGSHARPHLQNIYSNPPASARLVRPHAFLLLHDGELQHCLKSLSAVSRISAFSWARSPRTPPSLLGLLNISSHLSQRVSQPSPGLSLRELRPRHRVFPNISSHLTETHARNTKQTVSERRENQRREELISLLADFFFSPALKAEKSSKKKETHKQQNQKAEQPKKPFLSLSRSLSQSFFSIRKKQMYSCPIPV